MIHFTIPGEPVAKGRPRFFNNHAVTPEKTVLYENLVKTSYINEFRGIRLQGQIAIEVIAYFSIPKSTSIKKYADMHRGAIRPTKKPDADNILKGISDALNKIAFDDDSQIVSAMVEKWYSDTPRVEVNMYELSPLGQNATQDKLNV